MKPIGPTPPRWRAILVALLLAPVGEPAAMQDLPGLVVEEVRMDSAGARAGVAPGDRVLSYDERPLPSPATLQAHEENTFGKASVVVRVQRNDQTLMLDAPPGPLGIQVRPALLLAALTLFEEGKAAQRAKKTDEVIIRWVASAQAAQEGGAASHAAWLNGRIGDIHESRRQWKEAREAHATAWELLKATGDAAMRSRTLVALARCSQNLSDFPAAFRWFDQAALEDAAAGHEMWEAGDRNSLGIISYSQGDLTRAENEFGRGLRARERLVPGSLDVAASLNNLGNVANTRGDHVAAYDFHSRALAIKQQLAPDSQTVAVSLTSLGNVAQRRGDLAAAHDYHTRALAIKERLAPESISLATTLNSLGNVAKTRRDLPAALAFYGRSLAIRERLLPDSLDVASSLTNLGEVAFAARQLADAQQYHDRALAIRERISPGAVDVAASLNNVGAIARARGNIAVAVEHHRRALAIQERLAPRSLEVVVSLNSLGAAALAERRFAAAVPHFTRAIDIVEAQRWQVPSTDGRALLLAQYTEPYMGLLRAYVALDDLASAFAMVERARARSLLDLLTEAGAGIRQGVDPGLLTRERVLRQELNAKADRQMQVLSGPLTDEQAAAVARELDALLIQYQEVQAAIRVKSPRYAALTQPQPLGLREVQQQVLDENSLLLEYALGDDVSYVFAVTPTSIDSYELPRRADIERASRRVYELLTARQPVRGETPKQRRTRIARADADYPAAAAALSEMVLGPVAPRLRSGQAARLSGRRLLIVADGALQYVPFGALPDPEGSAAEQRPPLIVKHEVVSLPSASALATLRRELGDRRPAEGLVAVVADPVFDADDPRVTRRRGKRPAEAVTPLPADVERAARSAGILTDRGALSRLPFTRAEADTILLLAQAGHSTKAVDFDASLATATSPELGRYRIVHLASHGLVNSEHPELSGLVLSLVDAEGRPQEGFLRLHEVYNLNWSAELVVLSACETALGREITGEGLVGLTRGFMYAGARRVMASLWNVNDSVTAQFMKRFYQGHLTKGLSPAAALRAAQADMWTRKQWRAPYYWAAFVLQGEWR